MIVQPNKKKDILVSKYALKYLMEEKFRWRGISSTKRSCSEKWSQNRARGINIWPNAANSCVYHLVRLFWPFLLFYSIVFN